MNAARSFAVSLAALTAVLAHELGSFLVRAAEAYGVQPEGLNRCPDVLPSWVDDGSAVW